jgi:SNF2 family DNA or RNA helicase
MIIEPYLDQFKTKPYKHQVEGVKYLLNHEYFGLLDEMGVGKSAQVVNAACILREEIKIDAVVVVSPAAVRSVWINPDFGEIKKHSWVPSRVIEFHNPLRVIWQDKDARIEWCITNYEYIRSEKHRERLKTLLHGRRFMLILDESIFAKNRAAAQTKACMDLGRLAARRVILNGTPIGNNPLDLWSQINFLSSKILPYKNFLHFRADYCIFGGWHNKAVVSWKNLDKLQNYIAPHVIRREKKDCLDLPEKIYTTCEVALTESTWKIYKEMRDENVVWLNENPSMAAQAGVRIMRLSQVTSGFLGGFKDDLESEPQCAEIGREKLELLRTWVKERLEENPGVKIICWCRFRPELERVAEDLKDLLPTYRLYGQGKKERTETINRFSDVSNPEPALCAGQIAAGGFGLNLVAADHVVYLSNSFSLMHRLQSEDRVHRPGQTHHVLYLDVLATGPKGQRTIDHHVVKALREKNDLASWTVNAWKAALEE